MAHAQAQGHSSQAKRRPDRPGLSDRPGQRREEGGPGGAEEVGQDVGARVRTFLGEYRIMTPALAALFGFQLIVAFQESYLGLAWFDRAANFAGVTCTAAAILCLLVPASYHRFTSKLEETEEFLAFARASISLAFVFMPLALTLALYMQALRSFQSHAVAAGIAVVVFVAYVSAWWILPRSRARQRGLLPSRDRSRQSDRSS